MNIATKRKLKFCTGMGLMLICWCLCLMSFIFSGDAPPRTTMGLFLLAAGTCFVLVMVSQLAFGYIPPDPKDVLQFAKWHVEAARDKLIEIHIGQVGTAMRLNHIRKSYRRLECKKRRRNLKDQSIAEIMELIKSHTENMWLAR